MRNFVITQKNELYEARISADAIAGVEVITGSGCNEGKYFVHSIMIGGSTGAGGTYSSMKKAIMVANMFTDYLKDTSTTRLDFHFPDDDIQWVKCFY